MVRFNASVITTRSARPGERFQDVLELYIVYISEFDFLGGGLTTYHVDKTIRENGMVVNDGLHEIFVNTVIKDGSRISDLMSCFSSKDVNTTEFSAVTKRFRELKSEGGASAVCEVMEKYLEEAKDEAKKTERIQAIRNMIELEVPKEKILKKYSLEEYQEAEASLTTIL